MDEDNEAHEEENYGAEYADSANDQESYDGQTNYNGVDARSNNNADSSDPDSTSNDKNNDDIKEIDISNRAHEFEPPGSNDSAGVTGSNDDAGVTESNDDLGVTVMDSGRIGKPYDYSKHF